MLAVAIATMVSRALSYGTIYTTKLLRRGTDIDQAAPWRALADLKITDVMRPFAPPSRSRRTRPTPRPPAPSPRQRQLPRPGGGRRAARRAPRPAGPVHLGVPRPDTAAARGLRARRPAGALPRRAPGGRLDTSATVLRALARQIAGAQAADSDHDDETEAALRHPPAPLAYEVAEITITAGSPRPGAGWARSPGRRAASRSRCCARGGTARPTPAPRWPKATGSAC